MFCAHYTQLLYCLLRSFVVFNCAYVLDHCNLNIAPSTGWLGSLHSRAPSIIQLGQRSLCAHSQGPTHVFTHTSAWNPCLRQCLCPWPDLNPGPCPDQAKYQCYECQCSAQPTGTCPTGKNFIHLYSWSSPSEGTGCVLSATPCKLTQNISPVYPIRPSPDLFNYDSSCCFGSCVLGL